MGKRLDDIFNECYERVRSGENIESVLASYPEHAAELQRLLRTAFDIGRRGSYIQPRPEFRHWTGVRLQGAFEYARRQKQKPAARGFNWSNAWAVALTAIVIVAVSGVSTAAAASNAMPDQTLYPVKLAAEQARLVLTFSESTKAELYAKYAEKRVIEIETMTEQGKTELAAATAEKLASHLEIASTTIAKMMEATPAEIETTVTPIIPPTEPTPAPSQQPAPQEPTPVPKPVPTPQQPTPQETTAGAPPATETPTLKTKGEKTRAEEAEHLRVMLENSATRSLTALHKAMDEAPPEAKPVLQKAIDRISEKSYRRFDRKFDDEDKTGEQKQEDDNGQGATPQQETPSPSTDESPHHSQPSTKHQNRLKPRSQ